MCNKNCGQERWTRDWCLAISPSKARNVALSAVRASVRKAGSWARMSGIGRIAAQHADS